MKKLFLIPFIFLSGCNYPENEIIRYSVGCFNHSGKWSPFFSSALIKNTPQGLQDIFLEKSIYKIDFSNQVVVRKNDYGIEKYSNCKIFDSENWTCANDYGDTIQFVNKKSPVLCSGGSCTTQIGLIGYSVLKITSFLDKSDAIKSANNICESNSNVLDLKSKQIPYLDKF